MARVGHSAMTADELTENIKAAVKTVVDKIRMVSIAGANFLLSDGFGVYNGIYARCFLLSDLAVQDTSETQPS